MPGDTALPSPTELTVREAAAELRSTTKFVYNLVERGDLAAIKYGQRFVRIPRAALDAFKDAHTTPAQQRVKVLGEETVQATRESASAAPDLSVSQEDTVRAAFRASPAPPQPPASRAPRRRAPYIPARIRGGRA